MNKSRWVVLTIVFGSPEYSIEKEEKIRGDDRE